MFSIPQKSRLKVEYGRKQLYKDYITRYGDNPVLKIDKHLYIAILKDFYKELLDKIIFKQYAFKMPFGMGYLGVVKSTTNNLRKSSNTISIDWKATKEQGTWIAYSNDHSKGFKVRFRWHKSGSKVLHRKLYRIIMSRANKRLLAFAVKEHNTDYPEKKLIII